jgi:DNA-binding response OmpR family regulator
MSEAELYVGRTDGELHALPLVSSNVHEGYQTFPVAALLGRLDRFGIAPSGAALYIRAEDQPAIPHRISGIPWPLRPDGSMLFANDRVRIDLIRQKVTLDTQPLPIIGRAFQVLAHLVLNCDTAVSAEELYTTIWERELPQRGHAYISGHMGTIRESLGDILGHQRTGAIRTIPKVGYMAVSHL